MIFRFWRNISSTVGMTVSKEADAHNASFSWASGGIDDMRWLHIYDRIETCVCVSLIYVTNGQNRNKNKLTK